MTDDPSIRMHVYKIENRITFKIKTRYYLELLMPEAMKLLRRSEKNTNRNKNGESAPHLEITEVKLVHCNIANNVYQRNSRVLYTFVPNKSLVQLLDISPKNFFILKTLNSENFPIEVWFTVRNSKALKIEDKININLVLN